MMISFLRKHYKQFLMYTVVGGSAFVLDIGTLVLLKEYGHIPPVWAVALNQIFILNYVFFLNKFWSFKSQGQTHKQIVRFLILVCCNYFFSVTWMWVWVEVLHIDFYPGGIFGDKNIGYIVGRLSNVLLAVSWNFLLYKYWVYKTHEYPPAVHNSNLT